MDKVYLLAFLLLLMGCGQEKKEKSVTIRSVDFYGLTDYSTVKNSRKVIESSPKIGHNNVVGYSNIRSYNSRARTYPVIDNLSGRLANIKTHPLQGKDFTVVLDSEEIYTGYFWALHSYWGYDRIIVDPADFSGENILTVELSCPGFTKGRKITEKHNHSENPEVFRKDSKLTE